MSVGEPVGANEESQANLLTAASKILNIMRTHPVNVHKQSIDEYVLRITLHTTKLNKESNQIFSLACCKNSPLTINYFVGSKDFSIESN